MADLESLAVQIRPTLSIIDHVMALVGYTPPRQWTELKIVVEPATVAQMQNAHTTVSTGLTQAVSTLDSSRTQLAAAVGDTTSTMQTRTGTAVRTRAAQLSANLKTLESACEQGEKAHEDRHAATQALFVAIVGMGVGMFIGGLSVTLGLATGAGLALLLVALDGLLTTLLAALAAYESRLHTFRNAMLNARQSVEDCNWSF
jgi:hypothetical protein